MKKWSTGAYGLLTRTAASAVFAGKRWIGCCYERGVGGRSVAHLYPQTRHSHWAGSEGVPLPVTHRTCPAMPGFGTGRVTVRAVRNDVHNPPRPETRYWPRIRKSNARSASQAVRHRAGAGREGAGRNPHVVREVLPGLSAMLLPGTAIHRLPARREGVRADPALKIHPLLGDGSCDAPK